MFYLAREFFGRVEFIDTWGLATHHLHDVRDEPDLESSQRGLRIRLGDFFELTRGAAGARVQAGSRLRHLSDVGDNAALWLRECAEHHRCGSRDDSWPGVPLNIAEIIRWISSQRSRRAL